MRLALVLLAAVAVAGCRDPLVADGPPVVPPVVDPPPSSGHAQLYIKGAPPAFPQGQPMRLRAQGHPTATRYSWGTRGSAQADVAYNGIFREVELVGRSTGDLLVEVFAYDSDGVLVGVGARTFEVVR